MSQNKVYKVLSACSHTWWSCRSERVTQSSAGRGIYPAFRQTIVFNASPYTRGCVWERKTIISAIKERMQAQKWNRNNKNSFPCYTKYSHVLCTAIKRTAVRVGVMKISPGYKYTFPVRLQLGVTWNYTHLVFAVAAVPELGNRPSTPGLDHTKTCIFQETGNICCTSCLWPCSLTNSRENFHWK